LIYLPYVGLAYSHFFVGNFVDAATAARRAPTANPRFSLPHYLHIAALVTLGRPDEAKSMARVLLDLQLGFTVGALSSGDITTPETHGYAGSSAASGGLARVKLPTDTVGCDAAKERAT
jgi:hypothetical protein